MTEFVVVLTTFPGDRDVEQFAKTLVEERLAACVNVLPNVRSIYRWKDQVETADEYQLLIKTWKSNTREIEVRLKTLHPYDVPEFVVIPIIEGSQDYLAWISENTK